MNSHDAKSGLELGLTTAGTLIGGPVGGMIGNAIGTLGGMLIPEKTFIKQKTSFNENVDQNMSYSRADYGKGYLNYTSEDREKATTFSKIADVASDAIPTIAGGLNFKGLGLPKLGGVSRGVNKINSSGEISSGVSELNPLGGTPNGMNELNPLGETKKVGLNMFNENKGILSNSDVREGFKLGNYSFDVPKNNLDKLYKMDFSSVLDKNLNGASEFVSKSIGNFDATGSDKTVDNKMKNIESIPYKPFERTIIGNINIDRSVPERMKSLSYIPEINKKINTPGTNAIDMIYSQKNNEINNKTIDSFHRQYITKSPIDEMNSFSFQGLFKSPSIIDKDFRKEKIKNASGVYTPYNDIYFK